MRSLYTFLFLMTYLFSFAQLITWNFSGQPGDQTSQSSSTNATGINIGTLSRGGGLSAETGAGSINSRGWLESNDDIDEVAEQISENDYYEWTLPINSGYKAVISSVNFGTNASGSGPNGWELRSSIDGYNSAYVPDMTELTGTITFRLYGTRSTSGGTSNGTGRITSISIIGNASLPVTFSKLNIINKKTLSTLSFSTASETNNDYFTIERSGDGISFDAIGEIDGAGNSSEERHYEYNDDNPQPDINYYRIKQTDYDGQYSYSEIRSVVHEGSQRVAISPKQTQGLLQIATGMEDYALAVYSSAGQEVARYVGLSGYQTIDIAPLQSGIYFVKVVSGGHSETVKVVKY
jgi:hypothetical protein